MYLFKRIVAWGNLIFTGIIGIAAAVIFFETKDPADFALTALFAATFFIVLDYMKLLKKQKAARDAMEEDNIETMLLQEEQKRKEEDRRRRAEEEMARENAALHRKLEESRKEDYTGLSIDELMDLLSQKDEELRAYRK